MPPRKRTIDIKRTPSGRNCSPQEIATWVSAGFTPITEFTELSTGTKIVALEQGKVLHAGIVTDVAAALKVVWLLDEQSNTRKLIERDQFILFAYPPDITRTRTGQKST
ncbi:hypothetical protein ACX80U_18710 [Arthrobacter sp. TmT3-37]